MFWTSVVTVESGAQHGDPWTLDVQAEDEFSQTSAMQTVTVTAVNPCGVEVSATHPITVEAAPLDWRKVYLPLVVRKVSAPEA